MRRDLILIVALAGAAGMVFMLAVMSRAQQLF